MLTAIVSEILCVRQCVKYVHLKVVNKSPEPSLMHIFLLFKTCQAMFHWHIVLHLFRICAVEILSFSNYIFFFEKTKD